MKITRVESLCCGREMRLAPPSKQRGDKYMICLKCGELCERFYCVEIIKSATKV